MTSSVYAWQGFSFEGPKALLDQTTLSWVNKDAAPTINVTLTAEPYTMEATVFEDHVTNQLKELASTLPGYVQESRAQTKVAGMPAIRVKHRARPNATVVIQQAQVFMLDAPARRMLIATATGSDETMAAASDALDGMLSSLRRTPLAAV